MLEFNIKNQTISRVDRFNPATDSVDYLTAKFNFITNDWDGVTKKALFRSGTVSYEAAISASGVCNVPFEVLVSPENKFSALSGGCIKIYVSVLGTSGTVQIPTKECRVEIGASGLNETLNGAEPTPNIYEQFVDTIKADNDTTVAEIKADNDETVQEIATNNANTKAEVEALTERAETAQTSAEQSAASMKNDYANALKGKVSGEVVRVDDVSPVEHTAKCFVRGKNLFDISKIQSINGIVNNGDGTLTISTYGTPSNKTLGELCPCLRVGDIVKVSLKSTGLPIIYIGGNIVYTGTVVEITQKDIDGIVYFYTKSPSEPSVETVSNIQIEEGDTATEYTPYIDPSTVTLTRCGVDETDNAQTFTPNEDGTVDGVLSLSPTMTLLTDTEGVTVECEYNRDINKVIADLYNKLNG